MKQSNNNWASHDLRRTVASHLAASGISGPTLKKILNHVDKDVTAVYDRHSYDNEKRLALDAWARRLEAIIEDRADAGATVVPISAGQR
jgi:integrase